eukprot:5853573-Prorocentrum_lima.AAC.1
MSTSRPVIWSNPVGDKVVQPPFDNLYAVPNPPHLVPGWEVQRHHVYERFIIQLWQRHHSNARSIAAQGIRSLVLMTDDIVIDPSGDPDPGTPQDALKAAGREGISIVVPGTPLTAVRMAEIGRIPSTPP